MSTNFKIGDHVVCICSRWLSIPQEEILVDGELPVIRQSYVVRDMRKFSEDVCVIKIVGVDVSCLDGQECGFDARAFRLLAEVRAENQAKKIIKEKLDALNHLRKDLGL